MANEIVAKNVLMGKHITGSAAGSLAGEMKVGPISGSTGLTLNQMLIKLDDNATVTDAAIAADAVHLGNLVTLSGVAEDAAHLGAFSGATITDNQTVKAAIQLLETKVESVESDSDSAEASLDARLDVIEGSGNGSITKAVADLVDSAPAALDTLNELAAALGDDANFSTTITNLIGGVSGSSDRLEAAMGAVINTNGDYVPHSSKNYINGNSNVTTDLIDLDAAIKVQEVAIAADAVHLGNLVTLSGVAEDAANLGAFSGASIPDNQTVKQALQALETKAEAIQSDVDANEVVSDASEALWKTTLDYSNGFHVEKDGVVWKMGWGVNAPRISFEIEADASVTMSVDKETA